jgi:putative CocE/NonD family hydrolase
MGSSAVLLGLMAAAAAAGMVGAYRMVETMVPMRDGVLLHTTLVFPDESTTDSSATFPVVMDRSPYGYNVTEWLADLFVPFGFVAIGQDLRGTFGSEGNYSIWHSDGEDSYDLGLWVTQQTWSNGEVMALGASADGMAALTMPLTTPPWLKGQYVIWAQPGVYAGGYHQGAYMTWFDRWFERKLPDPSETQRCIDTVRAHEAFDAYWQEIDLAPVYAAGSIDYASGFYGGWYDLFVAGSLDGFEQYNAHSTGSGYRTSTLVVDPIGHCQDAAKYFTADNLIHGRSLLPLALALETFGIKPVTRNSIKNVTLYVMSSGDAAGLEAGMFWTSIDSFPAFVEHKVFFHQMGKKEGQGQGDTASSSFTFDPSNPVPTIGGNNLGASVDCSCGPLDQSELDKRPDVLTFQSEPNGHDASSSLAFTGPLSATLYVSSDAVDTDFMVKLSDVYPNGESRIIQDSAVRMRWREGGTAPAAPMQAGQVYRVDLSLASTSYVLAPGHALRVSVSSSNFPRYSVNPNNGLLLADPAYPGVNISAVNKIHHSTRYPSHVTLPKVRLVDLPKVHNLKEELLAAHPRLAALDATQLMKAKWGVVV